MPAPVTLRKSRIAGWFLTVASALAIGVATLTPEPGAPDITHLCLICGTLSGVDSFLNVIAFVPLGLGLALSGIRGRPGIASMSLFSVAIEMAQLLVLEGRHASLADFVTNSIGGLLGFVIGRHAVAILRPQPSVAGRLALLWLSVWLGFQVVVGYALLPVPPAAPYYGHIGRPGVSFPGAVLSATIGSEQVRDGTINNGARLEASMTTSEGAAVRATVKPNGRSPIRSEILVISGAEHGVASFEQKDADVIFNVRNGADVLLLRPLEFRIRNVFESSAIAGSSDTVALHGRYGRRIVTLRAASNHGIDEVNLTPRLSYGWLLLTPVQLSIDGDLAESVASAIFMVMFALPGGYWTMSASRSSKGEINLMQLARWLLAIIAILTAGLLIVPLIYGLRLAAFVEWTYCVSGFAIGMLLSTRAYRLRRLRQ